MPSLRATEEEVKRLRRAVRAIEQQTQSRRRWTKAPEYPIPGAGGDGNSTAMLPIYGGLAADYDSISSGAGQELIVFTDSLPSSRVTVNAGAGTLTIQQAGDYYVSFCGSALDGSGFTGFSVNLYKNAAWISLHHAAAMDLPTTGATVPFAWASILTLAVGDTLSLYGQQQSGHTVTLLGLNFCAHRFGLGVA